MITNIKDHRKRQYRWKQVNAVIEPTWQDNGCKDSDQISPDGWKEVSIYEQRTDISLADAVIWASRVGYPVTLYIYDQGEGIAPDQAV
ncbi:MAG: hypothetical protein GC145_16485 [Caulobacter sp.]|nr:hypothetical protein [Caulobacter sp.]